MSDEFLKLLERKLFLALRASDEIFSYEIRQEWTSLSPAPDCPHYNTIISKIKDISIKAIVKRNSITLSNVTEFVKGHESKVNTKLVKKVMIVLTNSLETEPFTMLLNNTVKAYKHSSAPKNKYSDHSRALSLNLALVTAFHKNSSRRVIADLNQVFNEIMLLKNEVGLLNRCALYFGKYIALPSIKWFFSLISALFIAIIVLWVKKQG